MCTHTLSPAARIFDAVCSMPSEYCEWDPSFKKCQVWFAANYKDLYPDVAEDGLVELMTELGLEGETDDAAKKAQNAKKKPDAPEGAPAAEQQVSAKEKKKDASRQVVIELEKGKGKKKLTVVRGMEAFGLDAAAAAKMFGKKFACGSALQKGKNGKPDQIEVQGSCQEELPQFIVDKFKEITLEDIYLVLDGKKVKASEEH